MGFIDAAEVARILGVSRARIAELVAVPGLLPASFPPPKVAPTGNRVWRQDDVLRWGAAHPDREQRGERPELPVYGRLSPAAERLHQLARDEARELNHPRLQSGHLVLAMLRSDCGGAAREVLESLRLSADQLQADFVESMGDPFEPSDLEPDATPNARMRELRDGLRGVGANRTLRFANVKAAELQDEVVASEHVLLALADGCLLLKMRGIDEATIRARVLAITEGAAAPSAIAAATQPPTIKRLERYVGPELARSPDGHDPWRRRPWGGILIHDADGDPIERDGWMLHYFIDRDGNPVLSTDGHPIRVATKGGEALRDENGDRLHEVYKLPPGVTVRRRRWEMVLGVASPREGG